MVLILRKNMLDSRVALIQGDGLDVKKNDADSVVATSLQAVILDESVGLLGVWRIDSCQAVTPEDVLEKCETSGYVINK